jgi:hypothetical protein
MAFNASSFFAGIGTVLVTTAIGFGGAILATDAFVGTGGRELSKVEQRVSQARVIPLSEPSPGSDVSAAQRRQPAGDQQQTADNRSLQAAAPAANAAAARPLEANAKADDAEIRREQRRKERMRAERRKLVTERKRRKEEEHRVAASTAEPRQLVQDGSGSTDPLGRLFRSD